MNACGALLKAWLKRLHRRVAYGVQAALMVPLIALVKRLPPDRASAFGGALARALGPFCPHSRRAQRHLELVWPELTLARRRQIVRAMWANMGRSVAEYPHLPTLAAEHCECVVDPDLKARLQRSDTPVIFFSGHLANWEIAATSLTQRGIPVQLVYRPLNNPFLDRLLGRYRSLDGQIPTIPKSAAGTRRYVQELRRGGNVAMLVDQKYNPGMRVDFMGHPARTADVFVRLAIKYRCLLVPVQTERLDQAARFRVTVHAPLALDDLSTDEADLRRGLARIHGLLEAWIKARPEQWFWLHRRWGKPEEWG